MRTRPPNIAATGFHRAARSPFRRGSGSGSNRPSAHANVILGAVCTPSPIVLDIRTRAPPKSIIRKAQAWKPATTIDADIRYSDIADFTLVDFEARPG